MVGEKTSDTNATANSRLRKNAFVITIPPSIFGYQVTIEPPNPPIPAVASPLEDVVAATPVHNPLPAEPAAPAYTPPTPAPEPQTAHTPSHTQMIPPSAPQIIVPTGIIVPHGNAGQKVPAHAEYLKLFPFVAEHLEKDYPTRGVARMLLANLKLDNGVKASVDEVIREAIFHADIHNADLEPLYKRPGDVPAKLIGDVRERVTGAMSENDFENNYQNIVHLTCNIEKIMIELVSKGEIGLSFWTMRSAGEKGKPKTGHSPYDILINAENMAFGASCIYNLYRLGHEHDPEEGMTKVLSRVATNPYVSMQIGYLFGVGVGMPIMADAVSGGHPIEYVQEHFFKRIGEVFHVDSKGDPNSILMKAQEAGHKFITERYGGVAKQFGEAAHGIEKTVQGDPDHEYAHQLGGFLQQHPLIAGAAHIMGDEISIISKTSGLGIRLVHGACMMQPVQTDLMMRACLRHSAQYLVRKMYETGELEKYAPSS